MSKWLNMSSDSLQFYHLSFMFSNVVLKFWWVYPHLVLEIVSTVPLAYRIFVILHWFVAVSLKGCESKKEKRHNYCQLPFNSHFPDEPGLASSIFLHLLLKRTCSDKLHRLFCWLDVLPMTQPAVSKQLKTLKEIWSTGLDQWPSLILSCNTTLLLMEGPFMPALHCQYQ